MTKALMLTGYGNLRDNLEFQDYALPDLEKDQILLEVHAAAINPIDYKIVDGLLKKIDRLQLPSPMGFDASGVILQVGSEVNKFSVGDEIYVRASRKNMGSFATKMLVDKEQASIKPRNLSHLEAAAFPLVALTTIQAVSQYANAQPGQHIFINAGAGGIGTFAIQYAKSIGLEVTVQVNSRDRALMESMAADHLILYDRENYLDQGGKFDIVYDCLGGKYTTGAFQVLRQGGVVVSIAGPPDKDFADREGLGLMAKIVMWLMNRKVYRAARKVGARYYRALTRSDGTQLDQLTPLIESGQIRPVIDRIFDFSDAIDALAYVKRGKSKGKVVIRIR